MKDHTTSTRFGRVEYVRFVWNVEEEPRLLEDYRRAVRHLDACEHCVGYELSRSERPGELLMRIEWAALAATWPLDTQPVPLRQFLLALKTALKTVAEVGAFQPVPVGAVPNSAATGPFLERKASTLNHALRRLA